MAKKLVSPFPRETYQRNAQIYKLMANPIRLEILNIIKKGEANVGELSETLGLRKTNVSQHLAVLRHLKLVTVRRQGQNVYYSIIDPRVVEPCAIFKELWERRIIS